VKGVEDMAFDLEEFSKELADFWKKNSSAAFANKGVTSGDVFNGLTKLGSSGILDLVTLATGTPADRIKLAIKAIEKFQSRNSRLTRDGVLGRFTRGALDIFRGCDESAKSDTPTQGRAKGGAAVGFLFYHVEPELQAFEVGGITAKTMISTAIRAWTKECDLVTKVIDNSNEANVIFKWDDLGGPGGTLAIAHIGGPGVDQRLELRFDRADMHGEFSTSTGFITTAIHEFGHIMGITHSPGTGNIMSEFKDRGILKPSADDIRLAQTIWGKRT